LSFLEAINAATAKLTAAGITDARRDAETLLAHGIRKDRAYLYAHPQDAFDDEQRLLFEQVIERRAQREPLQYIIGKQEFWGLEFTVTPDVLIPRPETELVVERALKFAGAEEARQMTVLDLCTGSGCIAISLATELPHARFFAIDKSESALAIARENADKHGLAQRIRFLAGDLFQPVEQFDIRGRVDLIVSNPPYVRADELPLLQPEVRDYEPAMALVSGPAGTELHQRIIRDAPEYLKQNGALIMELGLGQAGALKKMIEASGLYGAIEVFKDLAGIERVLEARKK
jgi:release factor glutamine methyltransferase